MSILELETHARPAITFRVAGIPAPKGSLRAFVPKGWSRPVLTSMAKGLKPWARDVRAGAQAAGGCVLTGGVRVDLEFAMRRPLRLPKRQPTPEHLSTPDLDKLARGVLDALTGVLFLDDSQVTALTCTKRYAAPDESPGVLVTVREASTN